MSDKIVVKEVLSRRELRDFIYLPSRVHRNDANWLPPLYFDEWTLFNRNKNSDFKHSEAILYLAYRNHKPAGRIMGLINRRYNHIKNENNGRFCYMEAFEDREVIHALLEKVEHWAREKGMAKIVGPLGFSDKDPQGFQIEGFDRPQILKTSNNLPYLPKMIEWEGYIKETDLVNYVFRMPPEVPPAYKRAFDRISKLPGFRVVEFTSKKELKPYIIPILELMNKTFMDIYGFVPLNDNEKKDLADRFLLIIDPAFIKVAEVEGIPVGFVVAMPDISESIKRSDGKLFPLGLFRILLDLRKSKKMMLVLGGIVKTFRGRGIDVLLGMRLIETGLKRRMETVDSHLILESNHQMRAECEKLQGEVVKRFRIYQKVL